MTKEELKDLLEQFFSGVYVTSKRVMFYHDLPDDDFWQMISNLVYEHHLTIREVTNNQRPPGKMRPASIVLA
jgi:hypothetical protein